MCDALSRSIFDAVTFARARFDKRKASIDTKHRKRKKRTLSSALAY
jgi:hypothetical protein